MAEINKKNLNLKCLINGLIYEWKVTNSSSPINFAHYNTYWAPLQLQFNYYDFLNDWVQKSKNFVVNQNNLIQNVEYNWFAPSFPNIYFFIYENISNLKIEKWDDWIQIKGALVPGDTIQIDLENFDILKNWRKVDFDWTDFFFEQWDNNILISFDWETQTNQIAQCFIFYKNNFY